MRVTCPKCQCKGLIDTAPLLSEARVTCVRCGTAFDALLVDGEVQTAPVPELGVPALDIAAASQPLESAVLVEPDEVLALPQETAPEVLVNETNVLDFSSPAQAEAEAQASTALTSVPFLADKQAHKIGADQVEVDPLADSGSFEMPEEYVP